jgi:alginate O-acetyltransferase complex protein AlgI
MLFNSAAFLFLFLPAALITFYALGSRWPFGAKLSLSFFSLLFYTVWRPAYLPILLFSIVFNYIVGVAIIDADEQSRELRKQVLLVIGLVTDVALLFVFKYSNFMVANLIDVGFHLKPLHIILPLAISFFTFQKIAWLVDCARGEAKRISFFDFVLFASFFPQLIAGPIVHYSEVVPQFKQKRFGRFNGRELLVGLTIFGIGLFKKTVLADSVATFADPFFHLAAAKTNLTVQSAWLAAITYTIQLYMDFSGYSDMAIGLGRILGVKLPLNFHSPLRASSIIDYWRRWHMTLQRFVVSYLYQPIAISATRRTIDMDLGRWASFLLAVILPSMITFLLLGIWHGAGWTFVVFGALHAAYIAVNQLWREWKSRTHFDSSEPGLEWIGRYRVIFGFAAWTLTIVCVLVGNVVFRASNLDAAVSIWRSMVGVVPAGQIAMAPVAMTNGYGAMILLCGLLIFLFPNTQQIMSKYAPAYNWADWKAVGIPLVRLRWRLGLAGIAFSAAVLAVGVIFVNRGPSTFIYFNF